MNEFGLPRYINVADWVQWCLTNNRWYSPEITPKPGMLVFYDWYEEDPDNPEATPKQDGVADHIGIVISVDKGIIVTVEGNVNDCCVRNERMEDAIIGFGL